MSYLLVILLCIIFFLIGVIFSKYNNDKKLKNFINKIKSKLARFLKHIIDSVYILIVLIIVGLISYKINFTDIIPELIGSYISIVFIDFILKENQLKERTKVDELVKRKRDKITKRINGIISNLISADNYNEDLDHNLITKILTPKDLRLKDIMYTYLDEQCLMRKNKCSYIEYIKFEGIELRSLVSNIISSYSIYIDYNLLIQLMECQDLLESKFFDAKIPDLDNDEVTYEYYKSTTIDIVKRLNEINKKMKQC